MKTRGQKSEPHYAYHYKKDQILGQSEKGKPLLYKVVEDMKTNDHRSQLRVVKLEQQEKLKDGKVVYKEAEELLLPVKERTKVVEDVEVKSTKPNARSKTAVTFFTFPQDTLQDIAKNIKQLPANTKPQKKQVSSESEDEGEDEEKEEEEEPPKKYTIKKGQKKQVEIQQDKKEVKSKIRKQAQKEESEEEEEQEEEEKEEEEEEEVVKPPKKDSVQKLNKTKIESPKNQNNDKIKKKNAKKEQKHNESDQDEDEEDEEVSQIVEVSKKKKNKNTQVIQKVQDTSFIKKEVKQKGRSQSQQEEDDEDEEAEEQSVSQSFSVDSKRKKGGKTSSSKKQKSQSQPTKFIKGKFNPNYRELRNISSQLEGPNSKFHDYTSIIMNNKELIRAAKTGNKKLLEDIFANSLRISNLFQRWGPENEINALELIFLRQDKEMLLPFIKSMGKIKLGVSQNCSLKEVNTGHNDQYAYGTRTRKVAMSRGGREGNNAFVYDLNQDNTFGRYQIERLMKIETDPEFFGLMIAQLGNEYQFFEMIAFAVRCGNWRTAGYLVQKALEKGHMYGFNQVHVDVLNHTSASRIGNIKKVSATKKTVGMYLITPVHCAAINPNHACLKKLVEISQEFNILDEIHRKPVHYAAVSQTSDCLKFLLENGIDAREGDRLKNTPLMLASQYGRTHNIELLASNNVGGKNREGNAAIHLACFGGHVETVKALLQFGAQINQPGQYRMTPLIIASAYGHYDLVKYLIDQGAKVISKDKFGRSACVMAARNGNVKILSLLLYHGAEYNMPDSSKNTPLHYAAAYGFPECIEELMKAGADQNLPNSWKLTPLSVALQKNHLGVVKTLLNYPSTDVNCKDDEGRTLISSSLSRFTADSFEYMKYLILEKNANVKIADLQDKTPLHYAVQISRKNVKQYYLKWNEMMKAERRDIKNNYENLLERLIELLINAGSDVNIPDANGQTPFVQALMSQNFKTAEQLMKLATPTFDYVDTKDRNILHKLIECKLFLTPKGNSILENIIATVDQSYINQYDENGWNPLLYLISEYTKSAEQQHDRILKKKIKLLQVQLFEQKVSELPPDKDNINEEQKNNDDEDEDRDLSKVVVDDEASDLHRSQEEDEDDEEEELHYRSKKAAFKNPSIIPNTAQIKQYNGIKTRLRSSTNMFQKQQNQLQQFGFSNGVDQDAYHQVTFYYKNKPIIVNLNKEQVNTMKQEALQDSFLLQDAVLKLFQQLINFGAQPDSVIIKRKKFRQPDQSEQDKKEDPYISEGNYTIAHFIFKSFHSVSFLEGLQKICNFSLKEATHNNIYPIHLLAGTCNLHSICGREQENSGKFLKYCIKNIDIKVKDFNWNTPTSIIAFRFYEDLKWFIDTLLKLGGSIDNLNKLNEVPLQKWVKENNIKVVELFLTQYKADPNFRDKHNRTALHHAINTSNSQADASFEMEHLLIMNGANTSLKDYLNRTPLFYAFTKINKLNDFSEIDPFETVSSILADKNCSVNCLDIYNRSPLHYAALRGSVISGRYMIKMNAVVDDIDKYGNTPLGLAFMSGHSNFCTMLIDNKANVNRNAIVIDIEKIKKEEKAQRQQRREKGEEIQTEDELDSNQVDDEDEYNQKGNSIFFGNKVAKAVRRVSTRSAFGQNNQSPQPSKFLPGTYSYFKLAIKQGWQGVAYLLISDGYDLQRAIEDAMMEDQFKLVRTLLLKVKDDEVIKKYNQNNQNLFHIFAIKGRNCNEDMAILIAEELSRRGVDRIANDYQMNTPLHYACTYSFNKMIKYFLDRKGNPNAFNSEQNTPFSIRLQNNYRVFADPLELGLWASNNANFNVKFKINKKNYCLTPLLYLIQEYHVEDEIILSKFVDAGCDINEKTEKGETSLILAIKNNSLKLVNFILHHPKFKKEAHFQDSNKRSPIHHVVQPLEFGSYENTEMLELLASIFDVNLVDDKGKTALDYAVDQDSGVMARVLKNLKAIKNIKSQQPRLPTSVISQAQWVEEEIDVEADAQKFLDLNGEQLEESKQDYKNEVDQYAMRTGKLEVLVDKDIGPYYLLMTKVDIGNGRYSENVFYKMQVLHEINRNVFILFTRWGRIGTGGQHQQTPFESSEEAIKEFNKIFFTKTGGNDWRKIKSGEEEFVKKPGKYQLMNVKQMKNYKTLLSPFDFSKNSPYPPSKLDNTIKRFILQFIQVKLYQKDLQQFHVDMDFLPIERLDRKQLEVAKAILNELTDSVTELKELRQKGDLDIKKISNISSEIADKSSRFYELIPMIEQRTEPLPPLDSIEAINQKLLLIETLLNFEITSKILLGAHLVKQALNPLTYCFNALNVRVITLHREHPEYKLIQQYINQSSTPKISNIFAIERRGEAERFESNKQYNRLLLWHGSKISNFMGILAQGLKVAPPWALNTGAMFGKGIYFADMFQKSFAYTEDWSLHYNPYRGLFQEGGRWNKQQQVIQDEQDDIQRYRYMLLCEVAVGKSQELYQSDFVQNLPKQYQSVKGCGKTGPDYKQSVILSNGCKVPVGQCIEYPEPKKKDKEGNPIHYCLQHNEYIVYEETKVKFRYMVQLDTKDTIDEY
ncbi:unnamed protein product (macronuclear) [Paramecium tetraurelia]|uniref:Poly [ADP-ribose] polymerase n=1 Tax=Paramecium tetraurelia TaxID=5888 RepID=A0DRQ5_PARTE|nr:uncharacterized protein GSPATT00019440001 [Paramecium tetraurelia]CAK85722.1 unnamed protein product [Paramecium tetraurelia]|eukprot:XP_001453119.1 hypothetical protein (macronuclear) [Paramecium tetraurelia strain d4-2]